MKLDWRSNKFVDRWGLGAVAWNAGWLLYLGVSAGIEAAQGKAIFWVDISLGLFWIGFVSYLWQIERQKRNEYYRKYMEVMTQAAEAQARYLQEVYRAQAKSTQRAYFS